jgi:hypothetical protein
MNEQTQVFLTDRRVQRAVASPIRRSDLSYWAAVVTPPAPGERSLTHAFLPKAWPAVYEKRPQAALDFSSVVPGDIIRHKGAGSRSRDEDEYWLIVSITDDAVTYRLLTNQEVAGMYRGRVLMPEAQEV